MRGRAAPPHPGYIEYPPPPAGTKSRWTKPRGLPYKVLYGKAPPQGPIPHPFIYFFWQKRYPFRITFIDKWYTVDHKDLFNPQKRDRFRE